MSLSEIPAVHFLTVMALLSIAVFASHQGCRLLNAPLVVGELLLGIILGPSILGVFFPDASAFVFPVAGPAQAAFKQVNSLAVLLLLFSAGLEMDLPFVRANLKPVLCSSFGSSILPFAVGISALMFFPSLIPADSSGTAIFLGIALAISALPVIIRILDELKLINTVIGSLTIASASVMDLVGWAAFTALSGYMGYQPSDFLPLPIRLLSLALMSIASFMVLPRLLNPVLERFYRSKGASAVSVVLGLSLCFAGAAFTEAMGMHTGFGALMAGALAGSLPLFFGNARRILLKASRLLSPFFFVGIGGYLDFIGHFDASLLIIILFLSIPSKIIGSTWGCLMGGVNLLDSITVGMLLNARGAMEIILAKQALEYGLIGPGLFVALAVMAILTSLMGGYGASCLMSLRNGKGKPSCIPI